MCSVSAHLGCGSLYRLAAAFLAAALTLSMNCLAAYSPIYCLSSGSTYKVQVELFIVSFLSKKGRTYMPWLSPFFKNKNHIAWLVTCRSFVSAVRCSESRTLGSFSPENPSHPSAQSTWATKLALSCYKKLQIKCLAFNSMCGQTKFGCSFALVLTAVRLDNLFSWVKDPIEIAINFNFKCLAFKKKSSIFWWYCGWFFAQFACVTWLLREYKPAELLWRSLRRFVV